MTGVHGISFGDYQMTTLLLVDGSSYLYRAFHALPDLRNQAGEPTGAIRGVLSMLRRLTHDYAAAYRACVFDAKGKTFREDLYPAYKANRPAMPDDLRAQIAPLHEAILAEGWPMMMQEGVEADDVIGTLTRQAVEKGWEVVISTGDKDLTQLVQPGVRWVNTMSEEILDEAGVLSKFGVPPSKIIDYLSLVGDTVDNVPGVPKCGPKTAAKWLTEFGSLDEIIAHADQIGGKVGENLRAHLPFLPLSRQLVTVATDVALPMPLDALTPRTPDLETLKTLYQRLEFKGWLKELQNGKLPQAAPSAPPQGKAPTPQPALSLLPGGEHRHAYETILTQEDLHLWCEKLRSAPLVALDTETTGLDPLTARLVGLSFATSPGVAAYLPLAHTAPGFPEQIPFDTALAVLRPWLEDAAAPKVGQNFKYDAHIFANHGITLQGMVHDTMLQSYILESDKPHDMDNLALRHLGIKTLSYTEVCGKGANQIGFDQVDVVRATEYAAEDADITLRLHETLWPRLMAEPRLAALYQDIEIPTSSVLFAMERVGVRIDTDQLTTQSQALGQRMQELEKNAYELAGQPFNLGSPKQLGEILFSRQGLPVVKKTATGQPSTDEEVLEKLAEDYPLPKALLEYRSVSKLKSTYTDKLPRMVNPDTGRVHTHFSQATAITGRLASSDPNLQNIPIRTAEGRRIRAAFVPQPGWVMISADYSQVELRIMAHLSGDARLLEAFSAGEDVHRATAAEVFGIAPEMVSSEQRRYAKVINFGLIYGMSAHGLAKTLGIERSAAQTWIDRYFARYPGVAQYMDRIRQSARTEGYVQTVWGRRLYLPEIQSAQANRRQGAERAAINAPMQGTAADLIKRAMIDVAQWLQESQLKTRLLLQVHDELILESPPEEQDVIQTTLPRLMSDAAKLRVPLLVEVGVGQNWDEAH